MPVPPLAAPRALLFNLFFFVWTTLLALAVLPAAPFLDGRGMRGVARFWMRGIQGGLRLLVGLSYEVRGRENLPRTPVLIAAKHQSAWETLVFHLLVPELSVGLKDELTRIPIFGWYLLKGECVRIDRGGAGRALRSLIEGAKAATARGLSFLIFPEGTRRAPGEAPDYKAGVSALYAALALPVVPVALNSGLFWGRRAFLKRPGRITVAFLPAIEPGLERRRFMQALEERIETATAALVAAGDAAAGQPPASRL